MRAIRFRRGFGLIAFFLLAAMAVPALPVVVENFDIPPDPAEWELSGGLTWYEVGDGREVLLITDGDPGDASQFINSLFWSELISADKFSVSFDFWIGQPTGEAGGEGMTFAWVREGSSLLGDGDSSLGFYGGGVDGYGVEFDTNPQPGRNHAAIVSSTAHSPDSNGFVAKQIPKDMENAVDAQMTPALFHVDIVFDNGHLEMWMSNENAVPPMPETKVFDDDIPGYVPYDAYFGFTAAMSSSNYSVHAIDNVVINLTGAHAGKDQVVWSGDEVTLDGSRSLGATAYHWQQIEGEPTVKLDNSNPPDGIAHFTAPDLTVGTLLTFQLDIQSADGPSSATVNVAIRAKNAPAIAPSNIRDYRMHLGFRLEWDPLIDADEYGVGIKFGADQYLWFWNPDTDYDLVNLTEGEATTIAVRAKNSYGEGVISEDITLLPMRNYALAAGTTPPSEYVDVLSSGTIADMNNGEIEDDSEDSDDGLFREEDYWGYLWSDPVYFDHVTYHTGDMSLEGGWFTDLTVQYTQDGTTWIDVPTTIYPAYDFTDALGDRSGQARFDLYIPTLRGTGMRIYGAPGGVSSFTSIAELEVFADMATARPLVVQGLDADVPERSTATLDGSFTFSTRGDITSAIWEQVRGPAVTIELTADPLVATFEAPGVDEDTLFVFKLTAGDGTETLSDEDVRITVKNLVTTAVAGPDRSVLEGTVATGDGSGSLTTSGNITYQWTQTDGIPVTLNNDTAAVCTFDAPVIWDYTEDVTLQLEVDDGQGGVGTDDVVIQVRNSLSAPAHDLGPVPFTHLLHLGESPIDRLLITNANEIDVDYLATFGGEATVNPVEGDAYDFTGAGVATTRPVMIWTPEYSSSGRFGNVTSLEHFIMYWHIYILSPDQRDARLHFANDDPVRGWNNGQLILSAPCCNSDGTADFTLHEGLNSMTFKLLEWAGNNYFGAGISDRSNVYYTDLKYAFGPAFLLEDAYAVRELPASYEPGGTVQVELSLRVNVKDKPSSVTVSEPIPAGLTVVDAGGGTQVGSSLNWSFNGDDVRTRAVSYTLGVPGGVTGAVNFIGTISFASTTDSLKGDSIIYENPVAPENFDVEMLLGAELSWSANPQEGIVGYRVFRSVNGQEWEEVALVSGTSYTDISTEPGSTYNYRVRAVNAIGAEGPFSDPSGEKMIVMEIREAEDFDYGGGQWPGYRECPAAVEAPTSNDTGPSYDFFYANDIPAADDRRNYRPSDNVGMYGYPSGDPAAVDSDPVVIGWISVGDWWKYTFDVPEPGAGDPEGGWVKVQLNISADGTLELYWDDQLVGTVDYSTGGDYHTYGLFTMEEQFQTSPGEHTLRVKLASGGLNFDEIGIGFNWTKPTREDLFADDFESYTTLYSFADLVAAGYTVNNGSGVPEGAWRLWNTQGDDLGNENPALAAMTSNYVITDSDLAGAVDADEEFITPNIDCTSHRKVRLDFNMNYRPYPDDTAHLQIAEVDIRSSEDGVIWGDWVNLRRWDTSTVAEFASGLEQVDISAFADGKIIQVRWHSYEANFDYWFAVDDLRVSGDKAEQPPPPKPIIGIEGDNVTLSWEPFGDGNYTVDYTDDLVGGSWEPVPGFTWPIQNTNWVGEVVTMIGNRFYRVVSQ